MPKMFFFNEDGWLLVIIMIGFYVFLVVKAFKLLRRNFFR